jgi:hypothetical protein
MEDCIYKFWEDFGFFNFDVCIEKGVINKDREHFFIVFFFLNVIGSFYIGYVFMFVI